MLIPYATDTAIYHWPFATVGLILLNIVAFCVQAALPVVVNIDDSVSGEEFRMEDGSIQFVSVEPGWKAYALSHGDGLHPIQWLTSFFLHGGLGHLIGNMIFLWAFGIVIEGKMGPFRFLALYAAAGIAQNILEQLLMLSATEPTFSLGASSAIYSLMMVALLWAPQDNMKCILIVIYGFAVSIPIAIFGLFYFLWDFGVALFTGFGMSTALLHVMGGATGLIFGVVMLKTGWVDCDNRDLLSMIGDATGKTDGKKKFTKREIVEREQERDDQTIQYQFLVSKLKEHLDADRLKTAIEYYHRIRKHNPSFQFDQKQLAKVINGHQNLQAWEQAIARMKEYIDRFPESSDLVRLNLARTYVVNDTSPRKSIEVLKSIDTKKLDAAKRKLFQQIAARAKQQIDDGVIEISDD